MQGCYNKHSSRVELDTPVLQCQILHRSAEGATLEHTNVDIDIIEHMHVQTDTSRRANGKMTRSGKSKGQHKVNDSRELMLPLKWFLKLPLTFKFPLIPRVLNKTW